MIKGNGSLLSSYDEDGYDLPFLTTEQILQELQRFGFYIKYDIKSNLPMHTISFLGTIDDLGYDKITRVALEYKDEKCEIRKRPIILVMKSEFNTDLLTFDCVLSEKKYNKKLNDNTIMNVTFQDGIQWDWLKYICNISDVLDENIDPTDDFETQTDIQVHELTPYQDPSGTPPNIMIQNPQHATDMTSSSLVPEGFTMYHTDRDEDNIEEMEEL